MKNHLVNKKLIKLSKIVNWYFRSESRSAFLIRRFTLLIVDITSLFFSYLFTTVIINQNKFTSNYIEFLYLGLITSIIYIFTGHYLGITRYQGSNIFYQLISRNIIIFLIFYLISIFLLRYDLTLNHLYFIFLQFTSLGWLTRYLFRDFLLLISKKEISNNIQVAIYGAGSAGAQLEASLNLTNNYSVKFFLDDSNNLIGRSLHGIPIRSPKKFSKYVNQIDKVLIAMPSIDKERRNNIIKRLENYQVPLLEVPGIDELTSRTAKIDSLRPIPIEVLLGRKQAKPDFNILSNEINDNVICITGAGGSIGSELCRQIIKLKPKRIVMIEQSELSLYELNQELISKTNNIELIPLLGNIQHKEFNNYIFDKYSVEIIFHTAAYKHVPIVENNIIQGIINNVLGTYALCSAASETNIKKFVLISSDKAVRPTNIMGATKRFSEQIVKSFAVREDLKKLSDSKLKKKKFTMVRFGNVLNSSGSVVPLFKKQISEGGPITLTHPEVIRYFMTIAEASQLVIQASFLSEGGEVFILDMGQPMLISELARKMILLSGKKIKSKDNKEGDIEIKTIGLRKGEKLYEELLVDDKAEETAHPLIFKEIETGERFLDMNEKIEAFQRAIKKNDIEETKRLLKKQVPEWVQSD